MMKRNIAILTAVITMTSAFSVQAAQVPRESIPCNATEKQIIVTENLVGHILDEVQNGMGYADARAKSNVIIFNAWLNHQTSGFAYGELVDIANNAIWQYRDLYLRPSFYTQAEEQVKIVIADIVAEVENGSMDYETAVKESCMKILQTVDSSFSTADIQGDFCYWNVPSIDSVYFNRARKLLQNAVCKHAQRIQ